MTSTAAFPTIDVVRFLIARIDEDDQALRKLARKTRENADADHSSIDRARSVIVAQRKTLGYVQELLVLSDLPREKIVRDLATQILRALAQPYSDHPMFRSDWHV